MEREDKKFFKDLVEAPSPSGFEQPAQRIFKEYVKPYADEVKGDVHGNAIALKKGTGKLKFMIAGHADEIGFMINYIDENGFLYIKPIGGIDASVLPGLRITIYHGDKKVRGVIGRKAIHLLAPEERGKALKIDQLWVDIGAKDKKDAEKRVAIGDIATFTPGMETLKGSIVTTKATDNKVGVYIAAKVLELLKDVEHVANIYAVSTVQEEIGLRGAKTSCYGVNPDVGIAVDVTHCSDYPGMSKTKLGDVKLEKGPVLAIGGNINPKVLELLKKAAEDNKINYQIETATFGTGTDANAIQLTRAGVATALISIPNRYMHTPSEIVSLKDVDDAAKLVAEFIKIIDDNTNFIPE